MDNETFSKYTAAVTGINHELSKLGALPVDTILDVTNETLTVAGEIDGVRFSVTEQLGEDRDVEEIILTVEYKVLFVLDANCEELN